MLVFLFLLFLILLQHLLLLALLLIDIAIVMLFPLLCLFLPIIAILIGSFASLTMLTKNSFLDEINKQYVITARAKGITERRVLYKHVFRNAMLIIIAGFPAAFIGMFFTGSLLIEIIFSLDGLGLLGFESAIQRDYPVMFGTLFIFTLLGLIVGILSDLMYTVIDPRIDFETRET